MVQDVKEVNFEEQVLDSAKPVLVDFYAGWCGPCRMMEPIVNEMAEELPGIRFCRVDVEQAVEVAARYRIMSIPTFALFRNGKLIKSVVGAMEKEELLLEIAGH
ncbi:MAG: thioredoxin [Fusicatenibacter sp.]|nr:thioredoxin [Lachnospiraceae bacterium]MDY2937325.1 thioredoxin [Fusicatenibacter sp.]